MFHTVPFGAYPTCHTALATAALVAGLCTASHRAWKNMFTPMSTGDKTYMYGLDVCSPRVDTPNPTNVNLYGRAGHWCAGGSGGSGSVDFAAWGSILLEGGGGPSFPDLGIRCSSAFQVFEVLGRRSTLRSSGKSGKSRSMGMQKPEKHGNV
eukprot:365300-Chlamydomonas_euryale.AAC.3